MASDEKAPLNNGLTLSILGCGNLGTAILQGIFDVLRRSESEENSLIGFDEKSSGPPENTFTRFIPCVTRDASVQRLKETLHPPRNASLVPMIDNVRAAKEADVIILACKPYQMETALDQHGMSSALRRKLLISILAGVSVDQIQKTVFGYLETPTCHIVRAMPNTAATIGESMTVIASPPDNLPPPLTKHINWIFGSVGKVTYLPTRLMDAATALCGSGPATFALVLEAMADGAVAMGIPRADAQMMAAQAMRGCAGMIQNGEHPALFREKVSSPGGCTIGGLMVLEEAGVRGSVARSVREATVVASQLGMGKQNVNGTRFQ